MKTVLLLRHAKSSWNDAELADFDRPLNSRGLRAAPLMGEFIFEKEIEINAILSSPAKRARQTAILVKETAQLKHEIRYEEKIYEARARTLLGVLAEQNDWIENLLLVGHNPGLENLIELLTDEAVYMKTATLAKIILNIENWSQIESGCGHLEFALSPRELENFSSE